MFHGLKRITLNLLLMTFALGFSLRSLAEDDFDLDNIENEMNRESNQPQEVPEVKETETTSNDSRPMTFKDLPKLSSFSDISVIQKKYMPKTNRFLLYGGGNFLTNNPFFDSYGVNARLAFFFSEFIGLEVGVWRHSVSPKTITSDLDSKHNITARTMLSSLGYLGASIVFVPFYGKVTYLDRRIIPYDFYFSVGLGNTETSYLDKSAPSFHVGTGQIFSLSKNFAWRWDLSGVNFTARVPDIRNDGVLVNSGKKQSITDLYFGIGLTVLFPGAQYR